MLLFLPKVKNMSIPKEVSLKPFHWTEQDTFSKCFCRQVCWLVMWSQSILIIPQVHFPMVIQDISLLIGKNQKAKDLPFCVNSVQSLKGASFLFPSVPPIMEHLLGSDYTGYVRHWRVTDEQVTFPVLQGPVVIGARGPEKASQHTAMNATPAEPGEPCSETGEEGDSPCRSGQWPCGTEKTSSSWLLKGVQSPKREG